MTFMFVPNDLSKIYIQSLSYIFTFSCFPGNETNFFDLKKNTTVKPLQTGPSENRPTSVYWPLDFVWVLCFYNFCYLQNFCIVVEESHERHNSKNEWKERIISQINRVKGIRRYQKGRQKSLSRGQTRPWPTKWKYSLLFYQKTL